MNIELISTTSFYSVETNGRKITVIASHDVNSGTDQYDMVDVNSDEELEKDSELYREILNNLPL